MTGQDPVVTDPNLYSVLFENERVRVLQYHDRPGDRTHPHRHPDSVMVTLSGFQRRVSSGDRQADIELPAAHARWVGAQEHAGENIGWYSAGINDTWANNAFMASPDHRANILSPYYHYVATSWVKGANGYGYIAVEFS